MRIKSITIEIVPTEKELTLEKPLSPRTLHYENSQWKSMNNDGLFSGEIRLAQAIEDARSKVGSI